MIENAAGQYVRLGSNLEFLRGICSKSLTQRVSLGAFPNLLDNLPMRRYTVPRVVAAVTTVLGDLEAMKLPGSLAAAEAFRPMLEQMTAYLEKSASPEGAMFRDDFAERLVTIAKEVSDALERDLGGPSA